MDATILAAACDSTQRIVEAIADEQLDSATPCEAWDVRSLLNHLVGTLVLGEALLTDTLPSTRMSPGGLPEVDLLGGDAAKAYRSGVDALIAAATDDALSRTHTTPFGEMPGMVLCGFTTVDIAVHGWDLAVAIGQDPLLDDSLATAVLAFARQTITPDTRAPRIAAEVPVTSTSPTDQLVGFMGRTP